MLGSQVTPLTLLHRLSHPQYLSTGPPGPCCGVRRILPAPRQTHGPTHSQVATSRAKESTEGQRYYSILVYHAGMWSGAPDTQAGGEAPAMGAKCPHSQPVGSGYPWTSVGVFFLNTHQLPSFGRYSCNLTLTWGPCNLVLSGNVLL